MSDNPNKIQRLQLENFTCFERADLEFSSGINVFIGENGTGKTHLLKVMYSVLNHIANTKAPNINEYWKELMQYFRIEDYNKLGRVFLEKNHLFNAIVEQTNGYTGSLSNIKSKDVTIGGGGISGNGIHKKFLFLPPPEMLSWQKGFIYLYERFELPFDKTYYDLAVALSGDLKQKGKYLEESQKLADEIRKAIRADVFQRDERFYFKFDDLDTELEAPVVAQGINKLGQLYYLILNGSLAKDTILFWDEPETGLNPKYIKIVAQFLQTLAKAGVQIFVATHDYLLVNYLSLAAEYREQTQAPDMKFFGLYKGKTGTEIETGATLSEIQNDAILEEYAAYYDLENEYFKQTVNGH